MISPLAYVDPEAKIGNNVTIHPFAYVEKDVEIGDDCEIMSYVSIINGTRIGKGNKIYQGAIIGADPQDFRWKGDKTYCYVGNNCVIRENVIINRGILADGGTKIGDDCYILAEVHIGHDSILKGKCVLGNGVKIAGDCEVDPCCIISSGAMLHCDSKIGEWSMIKGGCRINGNVPPYTVMAHNPVVYYGVNAYILRSHGFNEEQIDNIAKAYRHIYQCETSLFNALKRIEIDMEPTNETKEIVDFIRKNNLHIVASREHREEE